MRYLKTMMAAVILMFFAISCMPPQEQKEVIIPEKHNYIILLDLSDRLIIQDNQSARDKELIKHLYTKFEDRVRNNLYIRSRDEIKVVIAHQKGSKLKTEVYEDSLYINMDNIPSVFRRKKEDERRAIYNRNIDKLYEKAVFSKIPEDYYGADIWKYFYEDLKVDYASDTLTKNFLFIFTDGYPIVGKDLAKLQPVNTSYPDLKIVLIEAAPRDKDMEWDHINEMWTEWFESMGIKDYQFIKRMALSKEKDVIDEIINN